MEKKNSLGPGLLIGIPTLDRPICLDWAMALKGMNPPINYNVVYSIIRGKQVADARNAIVEHALSLKSKYLFFLGDDVICPPHTLRQLIFRMEHDPMLGVVGGVYCSKIDPPAPLVFRDNGVGSYWDWKVGEYFSVTGLGMDCTLIRTNVFRDLVINGCKEPFKTVDSDRFLDGVNQAEQWTEDLYFFNKLRELTSWKIYCDGSVICGHHDPYANRTFTLAPNSLPMRTKLATSSNKCLIYGEHIEVNDYDITTAADGDGNYDYRCAIDSFPFETGQFDWVIINEMIDTVAGFEAKDEWFRILKDRAKLSIRPHPSFDLVWIQSFFTGKTVTRNGDFIDII